MANTSPRAYYNNGNYTDYSFSKIIYDAGRDAGVSPYHLASRIRQEVTKNGGPSNSVTGTYPGHEGYYNFYNLGASSGSGAIVRGLNYAASESRIWNTPEKAIQGGAKEIATNYIAKNQDTVYLQKFDVDSSDNKLYSHQYQQNIQAPASESYKNYQTYFSLGLINQNFNFVIPVYENMPSEVSGMPRDSGVAENPNLYLSGESVKVTANGSLILRTEPTCNSAMITSMPTGTIVKRIESNVATADGFTWDKVVTMSGKIGYAASKYLQPLESTTPDNNYIVDVANMEIKCEPKFTMQDIKDKLPDSQITARKADGTEITDASLRLGTGMILNVDGAEYTIIKMGDTSGDGVVDSRDALRVLKYAVGEYTLEGSYFKSVDITNDNIVNASDALRILKYSVGEFKITV